MESRELQFNPYQEMIDRLRFDIEPSEIENNGLETEYRFCFEPPLGGEPLIMSAIWNEERNRFYFEFQDTSNPKNYPLMTEDQFLREIGDLVEKSGFSLR